MNVVVDFKRWFKCFLLYRLCRRGIFKSSRQASLAPAHQELSVTPVSFSSLSWWRSGWEEVIWGGCVFPQLILCFCLCVCWKWFSFFSYIPTTFQTLAAHFCFDMFRGLFPLVLWDLCLEKPNLTGGFIFMGRFRPTWAEAPSFNQTKKNFRLIMFSFNANQRQTSALCTQKIIKR